MKKNNLLSALVTAIDEQRKLEREKLKYTMDSGLVGGWEEILEAIRSGKQVKIID